jgi:hypothetical protein
MTTWATMRTACGAICLAASPVHGRAGKSQPRTIAVGSVADMPRLSKFVRASDLSILLLAFLGRQNALHMFHLAMFSEAILSMDAEVA